MNKLLRNIIPVFCLLFFPGYFFVQTMPFLPILISVCWGGGGEGPTSQGRGAKPKSGGAKRQGRGLKPQGSGGKPQGRGATQQGKGASQVDRTGRSTGVNSPKEVEGEEGGDFTEEDGGDSLGDSKGEEEGEELMSILLSS